MTVDTDTSQDLEQLRWLRENSTFKRMTITVYEQDEESCLGELDRELAKFAGDPSEWTPISLSYVRRELQAGDSTISVWELEAQLMSFTGIVPWLDTKEHAS